MRKAQKLQLNLYSCCNYMDSFTITSYFNQLSTLLSLLKRTLSANNSISKSHL